MFPTDRQCAVSEEAGPASDIGYYQRMVKVRRSDHSSPLFAFIAFAASLLVILAVSYLLT